MALSSCSSFHGRRSDPFNNVKSQLTFTTYLVSTLTIIVVITLLLLSLYFPGGYDEKEKVFSLSTVTSKGKVVSKVSNTYGSLQWNSPNEEHCRSLAFLFSVTCLYSTLNLVFSPLQKKKIASACATAIHVLACLSYVLMGNSWIPVILVENGRRLVLGRILEWSTTVPFFIILLLQLVNSPLKHQYTYWVPFKQFISMLIGGFSPLCRGNYRWIAFIIASCLQIDILLYIRKCILIIHKNVHTGWDRNFVSIVYYTTFTFFLAYPLIWCLGIMTNVIAEETETLLFSILDFVAKFVFTSILCNLSSRAYNYDLTDYSNQFWNFLKILQVPIFALDESGRIVYWNRHVSDRTKIQAKVIENTGVYKWKHVFGKKTIQQVMNILTGVLLGEGDIKKEIDIGFQINVRNEADVLMKEQARPYTVLDKIRFNIFTNRMGEVDIPTLIFVGSLDEIIDHATFIELGYLQREAYCRLRLSSSSTSD